MTYRDDDSLDSSLRGILVENPFAMHWTCRPAVTVTPVHSDAPTASAGTGDRGHKGDESAQSASPRKLAAGVEE